jgi:hypothetical protein
VSHYALAILHLLKSIYLKAKEEEIIETQIFHHVKINPSKKIL